MFSIEWGNPDVLVNTILVRGSLNRSLLTECAVEILACQLVFRMAEDLLGIAFLHHLAHVHEDDVVGNAESLTQRVGDHHDGVGSLQLSKELFNLVAADRVECTCAFVSEQIGRLHC